MATGEWTGSGKWQEVQEAAMEIPPSLQQIESNDLTKIKELGRGQFGSVWLCRCARKMSVSYSQAYHSMTIMIMIMGMIMIVVTSSTIKTNINNINDNNNAFQLMMS